MTKQGAGQCGECRPLVVTGARFTTMSIGASRGPARAPAWEFTLAGTEVRIAYVAVSSSDTVVVEPPEWNPNDPPAGYSVGTVSVHPGGRGLTAMFTGARGPSDQPCGADYHARAVESATAVVVIVTVRSHPGKQACPQIGYARTATVELATPLGSRTVLEVRQVLPVAATAAA